MRQDRRPHQRDVVCKITPAERDQPQALQSPRFAPELSCCWQGGRRRGPPARPVRRNALGPELRCCLQDCAAAACGPGTSAAGGCARRTRDDSPGIASSNRDGGCATSDGCPGTPRDIPDRRRSSPGGSRCGAFADTRLHCRRPGLAETSMAGKPVGNSDSAVHPYGRCRTGCRRFRNCCRVCTASPPVAQLQNRRKCGRFSPAMTVNHARNFTCAIVRHEIATE
jgi:hypothetical protein